MSNVPLPEGELVFSHGGKTWTARMDWAAIAHFERASGASLIEFMIDQQMGRPKLSHMAFLMQAALQRNHPGVSLDLAGEMAFDPAVQAHLFELTNASMPTGGDEGNAKAPAATAGNA